MANLDDSAANSEVAPVDQLFFLHPGNRAFVEGKTRRLVGANNWLPIISLIILIVASLYVLVMAAGEWITFIRLNGSPTVQGKIISTRTASSSKSTHYYVTYQFSVPGGEKVFQNEQEVFKQASRLTEGQPATIGYLRSDPTLSRLAGDDADYYVRDGSTLAFVVILVFDGVMVYQISRFVARSRKQNKRNLRLVAEGKLLPGKIVSGKGNVTVEYSYQSPKGDEKIRQASWWS